VDYASSKVRVVACWNAEEIELEIIDDGPGFSPQIIGRLGEPYVTTRPRYHDTNNEEEGSGMGLGFFIAKTLLERSNGTLTLDNREFPESGAFVRVTLDRNQNEHTRNFATD
jgi:two-component system sensor histidine kinase RegB